MAKKEIGSGEPSTSVAQPVSDAFKPPLSDSLNAISEDGDDGQVAPPPISIRLWLHEKHPIDKKILELWNLLNSNNTKRQIALRQRIFREALFYGLDNAILDDPLIRKSPSGAVKVIDLKTGKPIFRQLIRSFSAPPGDAPVDKSNSNAPQSPIQRVNKRTKAPVVPKPVLQPVPTTASPTTPSRAPSQVPTDMVIKHLTTDDVDVADIPPTVKKKIEMWSDDDDEDF